jgi:hypothetical protein
MARDEDADEITVHGINPIRRARNPTISVNPSIAGLVVATRKLLVSSMVYLRRVS